MKEHMVRRTNVIRYIILLLIRFFSFIHHFSYRLISRFVIIENGGVHPKHDILNYHKFFIDHIDSTDVVIDIGCGKGENAYDIAKKAARVVGIDINNSSVEKAKYLYSAPNINFVVGDAMIYPFAEIFDKIVLSNVLEHIEHRVDFLKKMHRAGDIILLRVPLITRDWLAVYEQKKGLDYRLDRTHYIEYTLKELEEEIETSGWSIDSFSIQFGEFWGVIKKRI